MRLLISGGGTAGHVYPALAVVEALLAEGNLNMHAATDLLYLGCPKSVEESLAIRSNIPFQGIAAGGLRSKAPWAAAVNAVKLVIGFLQAFAAIGRFRPDVILVTGGYVSVPVVLGGYLHRVPTLIYLPDIEPGLAVQRLACWASRVAVSFQEAVSYFEKGKAVVTGYPVRAEFFGQDKKAARRAFGLRVDLPVVTVFGGSRGAHSINAAVADILSELLEDVQLIHVCGYEDAPQAEANRQALPPLLRERYLPYAYLHEQMVMALAAADLVVARAGASTLGEFPALGLPAILVPYPYSGQHQNANADYLVAHGAAVKLPDERLRLDLLRSIRDILHDSDRLAYMAECSRSLSRPDAASRIAKELRALVTARMKVER